MKIPTVFVLDASAILKPFLGEEESDIVEKIFYLKDNFQVSVLVPDIFRYEFINTLCRMKGDEAALKLYEFITEKQLSILPLEADLMKWATRLMQKYPRVSFYDAVYHALAKAYKIPFVTADEKYFEMVKSERDVLLLNKLKI